MAEYEVYEKPTSVAEAMKYIEEIVFLYTDQYEGEADTEVAEFIHACWHIIKNNTR